MTGIKVGKLREPEARILVLQIAATFPNHRASTKQIKDAAPGYREFSEADLKPSMTRKKECMWQQIIGNATGSHDKSRTSIFVRDLATRTRDGIQVTEKGIEFLKSKGLYE